MVRNVTAAIIVKEGKILIAQKGPEDKRADKWEFPGGKIDKGETPEECLVREMMEEFEIDIRVDDFFAKSLFTYSEGQLMVLAYFCTWIGGELRLVEHADHKWVDAQELDQYDFVTSDMEIARKLQLEYRG